MMFLLNKVFGFSWSTGWNIDARILHLMIIPRRDLTEEGEITRRAFGVEFIWTALNAMRGRRLPHVRMRSDAGWIIDTVAARSGT
jgi:hypothetical protein